MGHDLVDRAKHGDKEAFTALIVPLGDRLYGVAYRILRDADRAEDAVQQTFLTAWRELAALRTTAVSRRGCSGCSSTRAMPRSAHTRRWQPGLRVVPLEPTVDDAQLSVALGDELERAFRHLSGEQRAVLVLTYYLGMSGPEVGAVLGLPAGTVRSRLHYARQLMRAAMEADARPMAHGGTA